MPPSTRCIWGPCALFLSVKDYYLDDATRTTLQGVYGQMSKNLLVMAGKTEEEAAEIVSQLWPLTKV